jgi:PAS domain-containing protein
MRQLPTTSIATRASALDDVLVRLDALAASPLSQVPGVGISVVDADLRVRLMVGPVWSDLGVDVDAVVGRLLSETTGPETYDDIRSEYARVLAGEPRAFSVAILELRRALWITAQPIRDDAGDVIGITAISWDQTDARHAEELYRVIADNATDVVTRHDVAGRYLYVSPEQSQAALWLQRHSAPTSVVATNEFCWPMGRDVPDCEKNSAWLSGISGRRLVLGDWSYTSANMSAYDGTVPLTQMPSPWPDRLALSKQAVENPTPEVLHRLRAVYGARWIFADRRATRISPELGRLARLRYRSANIQIYRLADSYAG